MNFPFKKVLVTGGAGFIGSHIVGHLLERGVATISIDNYLTGKRENLGAFEDNPLLDIVACDITDYDRFKKYVSDVDLIFHTAASKKTICLEDPRRDLKINIEGAFNVYALAKEFGVKKIVHVSTGSVYGEAQYFPQDENHPLNPTSVYGVSKLAGEKYASVFCHLYGMDVTILRCFHVYGPRQDFSPQGGVVPIFIRRILEGKPPVIYGDGKQQRSFTYVDDVVGALFLLATHPGTKGEVYNCASGLKISINELCMHLLRLLRREELKPVYKPETPGDIRIFDVSNSKIYSLGYRIETDFETGLNKTIEWLEKKTERGRHEVRKS